jgi:hypothetical protein
MIFWGLMALAFLGIVNQMVRNRRIDRHNRNIDRHNQMMEMLLKNKEEAIDDNPNDKENK